jgi:hypothetical protein
MIVMNGGTQPRKRQPRKSKLWKSKCWLGVTALSPFFDRKVLNVDVSSTSSRSIRVHHVDGSLVSSYIKDRLQSNTMSQSPIDERPGRWHATLRQ